MMKKRKVMRTQKTIEVKKEELLSQFLLYRQCRLLPQNQVESSEWKENPYVISVAPGTVTEKLLQQLKVTSP